MRQLPRQSRPRWWWFRGVRACVRLARSPLSSIMSIGGHVDSKAEEEMLSMQASSVYYQKG